MYNSTLITAASLLAFLSMAYTTGQSSPLSGPTKVVEREGQHWVDLTDQSSKGTSLLLAKEAASSAAGGKVRTRFDIHYAQPLDDVTAVQRWLQFDCSNGTYRDEFKVKLDHEAIRTEIDVDSLRWKTAVAGSIEARVMDYACGNRDNVVLIAENQRMKLLEDLRR